MRRGATLEPALLKTLVKREIPFDEKYVFDGEFAG
jgi:hypothetical protein